MVSRVSDPFFAEVLDGIDDVLQDAEYGLLLSSIGRDVSHQHAVLDMMLERQVEGVLVCSAFVDESSYRRLARAGIPVVVVHNHALHTFDYSLYHDDAYGARVVTRHLIELGHTHIAYIANSRGAGRTSDQRQAGYLAALEEAGLPVRSAYIVDAGGGRLEDGVRATQALLSCDPKPSAVFCFNDWLAIAVIRALELAGIAVPRDCSVAGFDNIALAAYMRPTLTTFEQPKYVLGETAAQMLLKLIAHREAEIASKVITFRGTLVPGESTAPLAG